MQNQKTIETELEIQKTSKTICLNKIIECLKENKEFLEWKSKTEPFVKQEINEKNIISMVLYWTGRMDVKNPYYWIFGYFYNSEVGSMLEWVLKEPREINCLPKDGADELPYDIRYELGKYYGRDTHEVFSLTGKLRNAYKLKNNDLIEKFTKLLRKKLGI